MKFSVFTASTPDWEPEQAARILAGQGWDGIEWRITDQDDAESPGFWAGNRASWPLTGIESNVSEIARITRESGLEFSGIGGYARSYDHENVERMLAVTAELGARQVRVTMPAIGSGDYRELFAAARTDLEWVVSRAEHYGVKALVELHHRTITASASAVIRLIDGLDPERVGVIHDLGNLVIEGQEDFLAATLRTGLADVQGYFVALAQHGYDGWVTLEDFSTVLPLEERTRDNLEYVRAVHARAKELGRA
jgi:sugar phosphate isomerase/epimerase